MIKLFVEGMQFGTADCTVINSWDEAIEGWIFHNMPGGLEHYRRLIPKTMGAPILIFDDLTVWCSMRRQGLGSAGMLAVMRYFRINGAKVAFLRIGTPIGVDWYTGKVWRQAMYERLGWEVLANHDAYRGDVPIMWHSLEGDLSCPRVEEVTIQIEEAPVHWLDGFC